ncbi:MAG: Penicillin-binding protein 1A [Alphaproteobacteria bacterium UBA4588]|nr:MAG: Penicillin-binding protein 1A [Alphaproteobacteria bacterium UBA4588]
MMKWFWSLIGLAFLGLAGVIGGILWVFWTYGQELPDYSQLARYEPPVATRIHAGNGALLAEFATQKRVFVPTKAIPPVLIEAFLSAEDKSFYSHVGVDPVALARAVVTNIAAIGSGRRPIGASTITQQVAKNFLLTNEVSLDRKIKEAILAIRMERAFSKDQILALYLNEIYLGAGSYGVAAAALNYFDKALGQLDLHEVAYLAALPKAPSNYHPVRRTKAAVNRRNWVLLQMVRNGFITEDEAATAKAKPLDVRQQTGFDSASAPYFTEEVRRYLVDEFGTDDLYGGGLSVRTTLDPILQEKAERALREGLEALDRRQGWRGPLAKIDNSQPLDQQLDTLTEKLPKNRFAALVMDVNAQEARIYIKGSAARLPVELAKWAYPPRKENGQRPPPLIALTEAISVGDVIIVQRPEEAPDLLKDGFEPQPTDYALGQRPAVEGAIVALDPHTGRLLAMSGGYDYRVSEFNRATQANRQPGSAFKPFVYLAALDAGYAPTTRILDAPLVVDQGEGKPKWKPANYTKRFYGPSIMRVGIEKSRNLMTARLAIEIGMDSIQDYALRFGINDKLPPYLSMSLGAGETTLVKLTAAYGQLVNGGKKISPSLIDRIQDRYGRTIMRHDDRSCSSCLVEEGWNNQSVPAIEGGREQLTEPASAYQMISMLEGVISRGTGRKMQESGLVLAGKTGTTNDNTNAWFIGFSPDLVAGVYVGYDTPRPLGKRETGSTAAVPVFHQFMVDALDGAPVIPFRRPGGITMVPVHAETGERVSPSHKMAVMEVFKPEQRPKAGAVIDFPGSSGQQSVDAPALY